MDVLSWTTDAGQCRFATDDGYQGHVRALDLDALGFLAVVQAPGFIYCARERTLGRAKVQCARFVGEDRAAPKTPLPVGTRFWAADTTWIITEFLAADLTDPGILPAAYWVENSAGDRRRVDHILVDSAILAEALLEALRPPGG